MSEHITRTITREQAEEWELSYGAPGEIARERLEEHRWHAIFRVIFTAPDDGQTWAAEYREGLTEIQEDTDPWDDAPTVTLTQVERYEKTVTAWRPVGEVPGE